MFQSKFLFEFRILDGKTAHFLCLHFRLKETLTKKYLIFDWSVYSLRPDEDYYIESEEFVKEGHQIGIPVPESRRKNRDWVGVSVTITHKLKRFCNATEAIGTSYDAPDQFVKLIKKELEQFSPYIHTILIVKRSGKNDYDGFDISLSCEKIKEKILWSSVAFHISIVLKTPMPFPRELACYHGQFMPLTPFGSEAFCVCNPGFVGTTCKQRIESEIQIEETNIFKVIKNRLRVPGMFDLIDSIKRAYKHITEEFRTRSANSNDLIKLEFKGLQNLLQADLSNLEAKLLLQQKIGVQVIVDEVRASEERIMEYIDLTKCDIIKQKLIQDVKHVRDMVHEYGNYVNTSDQALKNFMHAISKNGIFHNFRLHKVSRLLEALKGNFIVDGSISRAEQEMRCMDPDLYCTDSYHRRIHSVESELLHLYFNVYEIQKNFAKTIPGATLPVPKIETEFKTSLERIEKARKNAACPGFDNFDLIGQGCHAMSTFQGQVVPLRCRQADAAPAWVKSLTEYKAISSMTCGGQWGNLEWYVNDEIIDPSQIKCVPTCYNGTKVGESRLLPMEPGMKWVNEKSENIDKVRCNLKVDRKFQYIANEDFHDLVDIDECQEDPEICGYGGKCINKEMKNGLRYTCDCLKGYQNQDGKCTKKY